MSEQEQVHDPFQLCGTVIEGKYLIGSVVGDGGFGVVYRAEHQGFREPVAVKCLKLPGRMSTRERETLLSQLREEGRLLLRLSKASSSIVQALDIGAFTKPDGPWVPYLVLEWLEGETLAQFIKKRAEKGEGPLSIAEAVRLLEPAAQALATAHEHKVAHRDVKPQNLFLTQVGTSRTMKVLDFGIAKVLTSHPTLTQMMAETNMGPTAFTPRYGAPEQFNKKRGATGPWTDVFALALIVVELASGRTALDGDDPTELYIASADPATRPTLRGRGVPTAEGIERVLEKALGVEPKHRYAHAGEFWDALKQAVSDAGPEAFRAPPARSSAAEISREDGLLPTAEFAVAHSLNVSAKAKQASLGLETFPMTAAAEVKDSTRLEPTLPGEPADAGLGSAKTEFPPTIQQGAEISPSSEVASAALDEKKPPLAPFNPSKAPLKVSESSFEASATAAPEKKNAAQSAADPMSETPLPERAPSVEATTKKKNESAKSASEAAAAPLQAQEPARASKAIFSGGEEKRSFGLWIGAGIVALTLGGGAIALLSDQKNGDLTAAKGSASASASAASSSKIPSKTPPKSSALGGSPAGLPSDAGTLGDASAAAAPPEDMVYIPPAAATLGTGETSREVTLTRGFFIDRNEVTVHDYQACMARRMCSTANNVVISPEQEDAGLEGVSAGKEFVETWGRRCNEPRKAFEHPINCVDFSNAESYCRYRGRRLPTEAEWELAARGAAGRVYPWGNDEAACAEACFDRNGACLNHAEGVASCASGSHEKDATPEGIFDLGGNVAEWVADGFSPKPKGGTDPTGDATARARTVRGGSFLDEKTHLAAVTRVAVLPSTAHVSIGFRCAMDVPTSPPVMPAPSAKAPALPKAGAAPAKR